MRALCAQLRQSERGKAGDPVRPPSQNGAYGACGARTLNRLHHYGLNLQKFRSWFFLLVDLARLSDRKARISKKKNGYKTAILANPEATQPASIGLKRHF